MNIWPWFRIAKLEAEVVALGQVIQQRDASIRALTHQNRKLVEQNQNLRLRVRIAENKTPPDFTSINTAP